MRRGSTADNISEMVNKMSFNPMQVGVELTTDHRYLVNKMFKTFLHFTSQLSRNYENGKYDARNEYACKCSKVIIDALEKADIYKRKYFEEEYDAILEKSFD